MPFEPERGWIAKFQNAARGVVQGIRGQSSFTVHIPVAVAVCLMSVWLRVDLIEWCILIGCVAMVVALELVNSAVERMAKAVTEEYDGRIAEALNISSAAVLVASIFAALIGLLILSPKLMAFFV